MKRKKAKSTIPTKVIHGDESKDEEETTACRLFTCLRPQLVNLQFKSSDSLNICTVFLPPALLLVFSNLSPRIRSFDVLLIRLRNVILISLSPLWQTPSFLADSLPCRGGLPSSNPSFNHHRLPSKTSHNRYIIPFLPGFFFPRSHKGSSLRSKRDNDDTVGILELREKESGGRRSFATWRFEHPPIAKRK